MRLILIVACLAFLAETLAYSHGKHAPRLRSGGRPGHLSKRRPAKRPPANKDSPPTPLTKGGGWSIGSNGWGSGSSGWGGEGTCVENGFICQTTSDCCPISANVTCIAYDGEVDNYCCSQPGGQCSNSWGCCESGSVCNGGYCTADPPNSGNAEVDAFFWACYDIAYDCCYEDELDWALCFPDGEKRFGSSSVKPKRTNKPVSEKRKRVRDSGKPKSTSWLPVLPLPTLGWGISGNGWTSGNGWGNNDGGWGSCANNAEVCTKPEDCCRTGSTNCVNYEGSPYKYCCNYPGESCTADDGCCLSGSNCEGAKCSVPDDIEELCEDFAYAACAADIWYFLHEART